MTDTTLRILHTEASLGWGGQEIRILTEAATFQRRGHAVHLLCDPRSNIFEAAPRYGIARTAMPMKRSLPNILRLRRFLREFRPDVVNVHSSKDHWLAALARIGLRERPAIVKTRHISAGVNRNAPTRWLYRRGADFVMTTGEEIVRQLTTDGFLSKDRVAAVPTGMDTARFSPGEQAAARAATGLPADRVLFGIVATLRSWKGHAC
jgi:glycosyltransferase involved in cell wall biosynthesis